MAKMEDYFIAREEDSPEIDFSPEKKMLKISGISMPEDSKVFYSPLINMLKLFSKELAKKGEKMVFVAEFFYFNSASSKMIHEILETLPPNSLVQWHCVDDDDMEEAGQEFTQILDNPLEFEFVRGGLGLVILTEPFFLF